MKEGKREFASVNATTNKTGDQVCIWAWEWLQSSCTSRQTCQQQYGNWFSAGSVCPLCCLLPQAADHLNLPLLYLLLLLPLLL